MPSLDLVSSTFGTDLLLYWAFIPPFFYLIGMENYIAIYY
jgi:hypothetical protein